MTSKPIQRGVLTGLSTKIRHFNESFFWKQASWLTFYGKFLMSTQTPSDISPQGHSVTQHPVEQVLPKPAIQAAKSPKMQACVAKKAISPQPVKIGRQIEDRALEMLKARGWVEVARNYCIRGGEIDLIMYHEDTLIFVEVRYRKSSRHGSAAESITLTKRKRIIRAAQHFMVNRARNDSATRFDVIVFSGNPVRNVSYEWIPNAFDSF